MRNVLKDYRDLCVKPSWQFVKKHWKGYLVFMIICYAIPWVMYFFDQIREHLENRFIKVERRES